MNENDEAMIIVHDLLFVKSACLHHQDCINDLQNDALTVRDHIINLQDQLALLRKELAELRVIVAER